MIQVPQYYWNPDVALFKAKPDDDNTLVKFQDIKPLLEELELLRANDGRSEK